MLTEDNMANKLSKKLAAAREQVREAYENGATLREISIVEGVSSGTVRNLLIELGVELRSRGRRRNNEVKTVQELEPVVTEVVEDFEPVSESNDESNTFKSVITEFPTFGAQ